MRLTRSYNIVFLIPVIFLAEGLVATVVEVRRLKTQTYELAQERFKSDAALRVLVRDALAEHL